LKLGGRAICRGTAEGAALVSSAPISFLGGVDPDTGRVTEPGHELAGRSVSGRVLVFPCGKGSTVGSYTLYRMKKNGVAPAAIVNEKCETIVAVGAIISDIPCVDEVDIRLIGQGVAVKVHDGSVEF
jgi:predicted aconitase with swiveling domain